MPSAFVTGSRTYRTLDRELESRIRKEFSVNKGNIGAIRWQKRNGEYCEWRVEVYWREEGRLRHKVLGELTYIVTRLHLEFAID
jgi:hypothetical protein